MIQHYSYELTPRLAAITVADQLFSDVGHFSRQHGQVMDAGAQVILAAEQVVWPGSHHEQDVESAIKEGMQVWQSMIQ